MFSLIELIYHPIRGSYCKPCNNYTYRQSSGLRVHFCLLELVILLQYTIVIIHNLAHLGCVYESRDLSSNTQKLDITNREKIEIVYQNANF